MSGNGTLVVIGGPTASGKTAVAVTLGKHYDTEVISADSRQFYHAMRIGTARPLESELLGVHHHFLGQLDLDQAWSAGEFARAAEPVLQRVLSEKKIAVLVGGSGLYIDALIKGLDPLPASNNSVREKLQERFRIEGLPTLLQELERMDPKTHQYLDRQNPHRVIRALEVCISSGRPYSEQRSEPQDRTDMRIVRIVLDIPRTKLYARIDARVDSMITEGLETEARALLPYRHENSLRTVGYRELFEHFDGVCSFDDAVELIKQHSRNYAKRQSTWLRRDASWIRMDPESISEMIAVIDRP